MMELLVSKTNVEAVLQVAIGYNPGQFDVFIREAQDFDLRPFLCEAFYFELVEKKADAGAWQKLITGGNYEHEGQTYFFRGFADVMAYFTYARFILKCNYVSTSHGFTIKKTPSSEPVPLEERRSMYYKYQKEANTILEDTKRYIERNLSTYESWNSCRECGTQPKRTGFKTRVIK